MSDKNFRTNDARRQTCPMIANIKVLFSFCCFLMSLISHVITMAVSVKRIEDTDSVTLRVNTVNMCSWSCTNGTAMSTTSSAMTSLEFLYLFFRNRVSKYMIIENGITE